MGWKLPVVLARDGDRTLQRFVDDLYGSSQVLRETPTLARAAMNPGMFERYAMTYAGFHWVFDWGISERSIAKPVPVAYPLWVFFLHSVVNGYGFSTQTDGAIVRSRLGNGGDDRIEIDQGTPSTIERSLVATFANPGQEAEAWQAWCHAGASFEGAVEEHTTHDLIGEEVVFGLLEELTGFRMDVESPKATGFDNAPVLQITRQPGFFARLFRR